MSVLMLHHDGNPHLPTTRHVKSTLLQGDLVRAESEALLGSWADEDFPDPLWPDLRNGDAQSLASRVTTRHFVELRRMGNIRPRVRRKGYTEECPLPDCESLDMILSWTVGERGQ